MGKIIQKISLQNSVLKYTQTDEPLTISVETLVDTGAEMLCLPINIIEKLQLKQIRTAKAITANGEVERDIYSPVFIQVLDRQANMEVLEVPNDCMALLGYLPLETLDLYPNPKKQTLEGNTMYDGKMIVDLLIVN
jgi:predicted aspartyl protease